MAPFPGVVAVTMLVSQHREGENTMHVEFKEMLLELVPDDHMDRKVRKLKEIANVAGSLVSLTVRDGSTYLSVRYDDRYTEFFRTRNAGRPRKKKAKPMTCGEVSTLRREVGSRETASAINMSLSTFYRRYLENMGKGKDEIFT
ncbi:MAG: hypothetical protein JEY71_10840 [Sphaerochaeta sp.]|nr:hypothetical protein [Sphaerochaeta sp.]